MREYPQLEDVQFLTDNELRRHFKSLEIKSRPILMKAEMVRQTLAGDKNQIRRSEMGAMEQKWVRIGNHLYNDNPIHKDRRVITTGPVETLNRFRTDHNFARLRVEIVEMLHKYKEDAGWRGLGDNKDIFYCESCGNSHEDCTLIEHTSECKVTKLLDLLERIKKEK